MIPTQPQNGSTQVEEPSLAQLVRSTLDDVRDLLRAEIDLLKIDAKQVLKHAAAALIVLTASGVLLALMLSLLTAAVVLALHGNPTQALLAAALANLLVSGAAILWLRGLLRKGAQATKEDAAQVVGATSSQPRSHAS
jgi:hypothetical protein